MPESAIHTASPESTGASVRGKTLPDLLYEACEQYENSRAFNQPTGDGDWEPLPLDDFRRRSEEIALGLREIGLERGDKMAFYMESDVDFCLADMGCQIAGVVNVPIYLSHAQETIAYVLEHAEATAVFVSDDERLREIAPVLRDAPQVGTVVVARPDDSSASALPAHVDLVTLGELRKRGRREHQERAVRAMREPISPDDVATLIYTSGTTGRPKGVMLTHENVSFNAVTSLSCFTGFQPGAGGEVAISFLPLTHIYARTLDFYGFLSQGTSIYFSEPDDLSDDLKKVRPTVFNSVPRLLEKVYGTIQDKIASASGLQKAIGTWALDLANDYDMNAGPSLLHRVQAPLADRLVFKKWREALGGRVRYITVGGAALSPELANTFGAAGILLVQGYGLTETSPVITFNRPDRNRVGTVGEPIPDVEVKIADDGEILTRGPHVMKGYYKDEEQTREAMTDDGWFHTGDVGEISEDSYLTIMDRKKDLFKLSTGKYVMPSPLENKLGSRSLVQQAVVGGSGRKFCTALVFPDAGSVRSFAEGQGLDADQPVDELIREGAVVERFQKLVAEANAGMDHWTQVKRFALVPDELTIEDETLTPTMKVKRRAVNERYGDYVDALYDEPLPERHEDGVLVEQDERAEPEPA
jgi:long-chain acyl-CoA synthetase